jgi:hypothetical protein
MSRGIDILLVMKKLMNWRGRDLEPILLDQSLVFLYSLPMFGKIRKSGQQMDTFNIGPKFLAVDNPNNG